MKIITLAILLLLPGIIFAEKARKDKSDIEILAEIKKTVASSVIAIQKNVDNPKDDPNYPAFLQMKISFLTAFVEGQMEKLKSETAAVKLAKSLLIGNNPEPEKITRYGEIVTLTIDSCIESIK